MELVFRWNATSYSNWFCGIFPLVPALGSWNSAELHPFPCHIFICHILLRIISAISRCFSGSLYIYTLESRLLEFAYIPTHSNILIYSSIISHHIPLEIMAPLSGLIYNLDFLMTLVWAVCHGLFVNLWLVSFLKNYEVLIAKFRKL